MRGGAALTDFLRISMSDTAGTGLNGSLPLLVPRPYSLVFIMTVDFLVDFSTNDETRYLGPRFEISQEYVIGSSEVACRYCMIIIVDIILFQDC